LCAIRVLVLLASVTTTEAFAHGDGVTGTHLFDWHNQSISRVVSPSYSWNNLGESMITSIGSVEYLGETVTVSLTLHESSTATDVMILARDAASPGAPGSRLVVCDLSIVRSFDTLEDEFGWLELTIRDEHERPTSAPTGLYDQKGRHAPDLRTLQHGA
jgi:hypothetical protein|tara:strand:- start:573 stop:1049 length:477 start_codon:yes stop_codon:yes gene_type:complete